MKHLENNSQAPPARRFSKRWLSFSKLGLSQTSHHRNPKNGKISTSTLPEHPQATPEASITLLSAVAPLVEVMSRDTWWDGRLMEVEICLLFVCKYDSNSSLWKGTKFFAIPGWHLYEHHKYLLVSGCLKERLVQCLLMHLKLTIFKLQATPTWPLSEQANTYSHCFTIAVSESHELYAIINYPYLLNRWMVELQTSWRMGNENPH